MNTEDSFELIYRTHTFFYEIQNKACEYHNCDEICAVAKNMAEHIRNCGMNKTNIILLYQGCVLEKIPSVSCEHLGRYLYRLANKLRTHINNMWFIDFGDGFTIRYALSFSVIRRMFYLTVSNVTEAECSNPREE